LWIAQWVYDLAVYPEQKVYYRYFHDFVRDYSGRLPPDSLNTVLEENVILWQFTPNGMGPHYAYNLLTEDPLHPTGKKSADLNISIKGRNEFLQLLFGEVPAIIIERETKGEEVTRGRPARGRPPRVERFEPTYPGFTNQDMINLIYTAARPFTEDPWRTWIVRAKLEFLALPHENRSKPYTGPKIEDLPKLTKIEKAAILALLGAMSRRVRPLATYPGMTNQDMINLIYMAATPFTNDPWRDWVVRANLEHLASPHENRSEPYTGPKIEDLPNLTETEKAALLEEFSI
jgi:hypothetical protein